VKSRLKEPKSRDTLAESFSLFLAEERAFESIYPAINSTLRQHKKFLIPIRLKKGANIGKLVTQAINSIYYRFNAGECLCDLYFISFSCLFIRDVQVGTSLQSVEQISDNIMASFNQIVKSVTMKEKSNVVSLGVRTSHSITIPIYKASSLPNPITISDATPTPNTAPTPISNTAPTTPAISVKTFTTNTNQPVDEEHKVKNPPQPKQQSQQKTFLHYLETDELTDDEDVDDEAETDEPKFYGKPENKKFVDKRKQSGDRNTEKGKQAGKREKMGDKKGERFNQVGDKKREKRNVKEVVQPRRRGSYGGDDL